MGRPRVVRHPLWYVLRFSAGALLVALVHQGLLLGLPQPHLSDFRTIMAAGAAARRGLNPYDVYPLTTKVQILDWADANPNLNPPVTAWVFELLTPAVVDPQWDSGLHPVLFAQLRAWWAVYVICYGALLWLLHLRYRRFSGPWRLAWALSITALWDTLGLGTFYIPLALLVVGVWLLLADERPTLAGLVLGVLVAVKLNFLVWPVVLLLAGHRRCAIVGLLTAAAVSALPLLHFGPEVYHQWAAVVGDVGVRAGFPTNGSLIGLATRAKLGYGGHAAAALSLLGLAWWAWKDRPGVMRASALALLFSLLASPIAWVQYALFLLPIYMSYRRWGPWMWASAVMLLFPVYYNISFWGSGDPLLQWTGGCLYNAAYLALLVGLIRRPDPVVP